MTKNTKTHNEHGFKILNFAKPGDVPSADSEIKRKEQQWAWAEYWASQPFDYFITLAFNDTHSIDFAQKTIRRWHKHIDRRIVGNGHYKKPTHERIFFVAMFEHLDTNLHAHMLLKLPDISRKQQFEDLADKEWQALVEKGDLDCSELDKPNSTRWTALYSSKGLNSNRHYEAAMISDCNAPSHFTK